MELKKNSNQEEIEKIASKLEKYMESKFTSEQRKALHCLLSEQKYLFNKNDNSDFFKKTTKLTNDDLSNLAEAIQKEAAFHVSGWQFNAWDFAFK